MAKSDTIRHVLRHTHVIYVCGFHITLIVGALLTTSLARGTDESVFFHEQIEPLLRKHCFECHSHTSGTMEGGLALDWRSGWELGGSRGPTIQPGDPESSLLVKAIRHTDPELKMPEDKLSEHEISLLTQWVSAGAFDDRRAQPDLSFRPDSLDWWSLRPLQRPVVPGDPSEHPIDAFIQARLRREGLESSSEADRRTLIRRVTYDLTGLPPTPEEVESFETDVDLLAYEKLVDRLLASPRYGERWARHWLDTIHFADSHGFEHDIPRNHAWRFRDYVIASFNRDTPWPRFIREQLAADYFFPGETSLIPALGFLGAGTFDLSAFSTAPVTFDYLDRDDLVTQTMAAFVSTTANCARCHAHKFDPISQEDYYSLQAVFAGVLKGDLAYDEASETARARSHWTALQDAARRRDPKVLLAAENTPLVAKWITEQRPGPRWTPLECETFLSTDGSSISRQKDGLLVAGGTRPDRDTYLVSATTTLSRITAFHLEVVDHDSLPMRGPGRQDNGNFHLSEFEIQCFEPGEERSVPVKFRRATADFNQEGWSIERAMDGDAATAWGIHPAIGQSHVAVFELESPIALRPGSKLSFLLRQLHGNGHLIGAFRLAATDDDAVPLELLPLEVSTALAVAEGSRTDEQRTAIAAHVLQRFAAESLQKLPPQSVVYAAASAVNIPAGEGQLQAHAIPSPKVVNILERGDFAKPGDVARPGALSALAHLPSRFVLRDPSQEAERRAQLAEWIADPGNSLTYRSIVNRVWHYHFGLGLCSTPSDFGRMGSAPSHPELLDWLAVWFRDDAHGSLKQLHRLIVTSKAYRQSSQDRIEPAKMDRDNRWVWRQNRQRLDAESFRDFTLAVAGALDFSMGGPGLQCFSQKKGPQITPTLNYSEFDWNSPGAGRRSIYRFVWRGIPDPFMEQLDFPDLGLLAPVRGFSASSLQALALYNNDFVLHSSAALARRVEQEGISLEDQVTRVVRLVWCRYPTPGELHELTEFARLNTLQGLCRVLLNSNEFLFVD
jgi:Protein of unknown function (DUF1549)/Protein of unknown function (DUF1553)/Planctomycete cytochrome C